MNNRLLQFINAENISQSQFADIIGVARASVSHILSGRNKPGFDFIVSMSNHFPALNVEWLITGKGKMYKNGVSPTPVTIHEEDDLFANIPTNDDDTPASVQASPAAVTSPVSSTFQQLPEQTAKVTGRNTVPSPAAALPSPGKTISKIIVFYSDNSFQELG